MVFRAVADEDGGHGLWRWYFQAHFTKPTQFWGQESGPEEVAYSGNLAFGIVAVTPYGRRALSASEDRTLRLWDLENGEEIDAFAGESDMLSCALTSDGRTIVVGEYSGEVHFLRLVEADETKPAIGDTKIQLLRQKEQARSATDS
jgi:WD40 repeat protein